KLHGVFSRRASRALRPSFAGDAALARRCEQLPAGAGTPTRLVGQGPERSTIERDRVTGRVVRGFLVCATVADRLGVTTRSRETLPMRFIVRRLGGVAKRVLCRVAHRGLLAQSGAGSASRPQRRNRGRKLAADIDICLNEAKLATARE